MTDAREFPDRLEYIVKDDLPALVAAIDRALPELDR